VCNRFCALLAASLRPQVKSGHNGCDKATRRANHQKSVHPFAQKYSASVVGQISDLNPAVPPDKRGVAHVTKRAVGCGGREDGGDERLTSRTAKSRGPGAPMLASSFREAFFPG
jgi:hypothetical protein